MRTKTILIGAIIATIIIIIVLLVTGRGCSKYGCNPADAWHPNSIVDYTVILAGWLFWFIGYCYFQNRTDVAKQKELSEIGPFLQGLGFTETAKKTFLGLAPPRWDGSYRGRDFKLEMFYPSGVLESIALRITTPNHSNYEPNIILNNKEQMGAAGLETIYQRLDAVGMLSQIWRGSDYERSVDGVVSTATGAIGLSEWPLFHIKKDVVVYILPGHMASKDNLKESLDIVCDTAQKLSI